MVGVVVTLSGQIGSGRSRLSEQLAEKLACPRVKFSDVIAEMISADGNDPTDRALLQSYGQNLIQNRLEWFVDETVSRAPGWQPGGHLVVDGLRHTEALIALKKRVSPSRVFYVHVKIDPLRRESGAKERGIAEQLLYRYDRDLTEAQISRILPAYADLTVDGALGSSINLVDIVQRVNAIRGQD